MIFDAARLAFADLFGAPLRGVFFKTVGLTLVGLVAAWFGLKELFDWLAMPGLESLTGSLPGWLSWLGPAANIVAGLLLALVMAFLIAPVTAFVAGFFLDDVAGTVERQSYPADRPGEAPPTAASMVASAKFLGVVIAGNLLALFLLLIPGVNLVAFFAVNGYLLGREYFEFAAQRFRPEAEAKSLRAGNAGTVFAAGLLVAAFMAVPVLNLLTPLFAGSLMVHLHKAVSARDARAARG